jgi:penicillin-binding protein 1A
VSHDEGAAPYFRETLRAELKRMLAEKDADGNHVLAKADGSAYDIYRDGLRVVTTIDSRMQDYAEQAVHRHLAGELQASFERDLRDRPKEVAPFFEDINPEARQAILDVAMRDADRYKIGIGKLCPSCNRPGFYIKSTTLEDGRDGHVCSGEKGGCGHTWLARTDEEMRRLFTEPVTMKVFSHQGAVDTVLSPMDSILHRKAILHAGLVSVEPATGHIKAWVGGIDFKHFQYDNVGQSRRQVGSTFKPFVYATALRLGAEPCDEFPNQKTCIDLPPGSDPPSVVPRQQLREYGEMVTLEYALANSMNTVTAKLIKDYGTKRVIDLAHALGIESDIPNVPSIALGVAQLTLRELVSANASIVNHGVYVEPTFIARIEDRFGNPVYEPQQRSGKAGRPHSPPCGADDERRGGRRVERGVPKAHGHRHPLALRQRCPRLRRPPRAHGWQDRHDPKQHGRMVHGAHPRFGHRRVGGRPRPDGPLLHHPPRPRGQHGLAHLRLLHEGRLRRFDAGGEPGGLPPAGEHWRRHPDVPGGRGTAWTYL